MVSSSFSRKKNRFKRNMSSKNTISLPNLTPYSVLKLDPFKKNNTINRNIAKGNTSVMLPSLTPFNVLKKDTRNNNRQTMRSYRPSINEKLVSLNTVERTPLNECNTQNAFQLKEELKVKVNGKCFPYTSEIAQNELLNRLKMNKHINPKKMITPIQSLSNCWFNTMFVRMRSTKI